MERGQLEVIKKDETLYCLPMMVVTSVYMSASRMATYATMETAVTIQWLVKLWLAPPCSVSSVTVMKDGSAVTRIRGTRTKGKAKESAT